jgi:hypothetical protein
MRTLLFVAVVALGSFGCSSKSSDKAGTEVKSDLPEMTVEEVATALEAKQVTPVDCNSDKTRKKHGILPGAILLEDEEAFPASALPADKSTKLVFYCAGNG